MLNQIILMGLLTRDPELRRTQSGIAVVRFTLAVERDFSPKGEGKQTDFIDIVAWRSTAEFVSKYFRKGQLVAVSGRLQIRDWTDDNDGKRRAAEVVADNVYFAEKREKGSGSTQNAQQPAYTPASSSSYYVPNTNPAAINPFAELDENDEDLPF